MNIDLYIDTQNKLINNSSSEINKLYCDIENTNENIINLYANTDYTFKFSSNTINSTLNLSTYYIAFFYNFNYYTDTTTKNDFTFIKGLTDIIIDSNNFINTNIKFKLVDMNYNYTWSIFKINSNNVYEEFLNGKIRINYPLIFIKLIVNDGNLIHDENNVYYETYKDLIHINHNQNLGSNKLDILLYENNNYIFELVYNSTNLFFDIYLNSNNDYNKITHNSTTYSNLYIKNIPKFNISNKMKKNKYLWSISQSSNILYNGNISLVNLNRNTSNDEKLYDFKFKNIAINNRLLYNKFSYNENLNIKNINNIVNYLSIYDSHKFLIIDNTNTNISIVLPSTNIYLGLTYNILIKRDLNTINIYCEDNTETLSNYDKIKGSLFVINSDNLYCKCISSHNEIITSTNIETSLSENIIIKKIRLNNGNIYNGGLNTYGVIKLICSDYLDNKYIWNIEGKLIGKSILYANTYLYNPFI